MSLFLQLLGNGIIQGMLAACLAVGFGLVYRSCRLFHIAMGAQFVFSCYAFYFLAVRVALPIAVAGIGALLFSVGFAWLVEAVVYRPFFNKRCSSGILMIASLCVLTVTENIVALIFGNEVKTVSNTLEPAVVLGGLRFTRIQLVQLFVGAGIFSATGILVCRNRYCKAVWAMGDQPGLIPVLGLPVGRLRLLIMALGAVMTAFPAILISYDIGMDPYVGMHYLLLASVAVFFGGVDRYWAWGAGALILCVLQSLTVWRFSAKWTDLVTFIILICVLIFRPQGLFGTRKRLEEQS